MPGLLDASRSALLLVDVQARLVPHIAGAGAVVEGCVWLARLATRLGIPVVVSEHCPERLGGTLPGVLAVLPEGARVLPKSRFSAAAEPAIAGSLADAPATQIVVAGMEAHVCVLQTCLGLLAAGREVFVVEDAVGSRRESSRDRALARLAAAGAAGVEREMVFFEWMADASAPEFPALLGEFMGAGSGSGRRIREVK